MLVNILVLEILIVICEMKWHLKTMQYWTTGHTTLLRRWINVNDIDSTSQQRHASTSDALYNIEVGPTLYKCYVMCLLGCWIFVNNVITTCLWYLGCRIKNIRLETLHEKTAAVCFLSVVLRGKVKKKPYIKKKLDRAHPTRQPPYPIFFLETNLRHDLWRFSIFYPKWPWDHPPTSIFFDVLIF